MSKQSTSENAVPSYHSVVPPCPSCHSDRWNHRTECENCENAICNLCAGLISDDERLCRRCAGIILCPNCGEPATFTRHEDTFTETHGLDCGPYETWTDFWLTCNKCGAKTDPDEVAAMQEVS